MWNVIQELRRTKGTNAKKILLENHLELQPVLRHAYDPFLQYGITPPTTGGFGNSTIDGDVFVLLADLASGILSGNRAKKAVAECLNQLDYGSSQILRCILNKSFDIGLAEKSINEVFHGLIPVHAIQLAKPLVENKKGTRTENWNRVKFPCYISPKLDGLRAIFRDGVFYSRKGHRLEGLKTLTAHVNFYVKKMGNATLDGELMVPGVKFDETSGKIRSFNETPDAVYHVFDIPSSTDTFQTRRDMLIHFLPANGPVRRVIHAEINCKEDAQAAYAMYREEGFEGAVLKAPNAVYENARTWAWIKMKNTDTADLKVVGLYEGQGKYEGLVGGIYVDFNGKRVGVGSGLTDRQRNAWADEPEEIMGKIVEVAYMEVTPDGSLRHPRLINVRGDK